MAGDNALTAVLIISHDVVGEKMAGPGIRYFQLANVLAKHFDVTLAMPVGSLLPSAQVFATLIFDAGDDSALQQAIERVDVVVMPALFVVEVPILQTNRVPVVVDAYNPIVPENLALQADVYRYHQLLATAYLRGDFFICAGNRQRDRLLGLLEAYGRLNNDTYAGDASLRQLVDLVPFGLPPSPPQSTQSQVKGVWPGINAHDKVILWGGGLWPWLDADTAVRAIARIWQQRQDVKLIFPGTKHPNPVVAENTSFDRQTKQLAAELNVLGKAVFFGDWVPYADWPNVLLDSDLALTLHHNTLETRFAYRSRALDYIWAELPIVASRGDEIGDLVANYQLGITVPPGNALAVADAIMTLLDKPVDADTFTQVKASLSWQAVSKPLVDFCRNPKPASDRMQAQGLGSPYYIPKLNALQEIINGYERGRFIRFMRWLHKFG